jgi:hypothetical protein
MTNTQPVYSFGVIAPLRASVQLTIGLQEQDNPDNLEALLKLERGVGTPVFVTDFWRYGTIILDPAYLAVATHQGDAFTAVRIKWATLHLGDEETHT